MSRFYYNNQLVVANVDRAVAGDAIGRSVAQIFTYVFTYMFPIAEYNIYGTNLNNNNN